MPLDVIGAGFGRTGTMSLKLALEQLGFGPCYHMVTLFQMPGAADHWANAAQGRLPDWDTVFAGFRSTTDWPAADYWRELAAHYPAAKVILSVREPEAWFRSTQQTIFSAANTLMSHDPSPVGQTMRAINARHFGGNPGDHDACIAAMARHNAQVQATIPAERLLVLDIAEGWEPLCRFLGVPQPQTPFPRANSTEEFQSRVKAIVDHVTAQATAEPPVTANLQ